MQKEKSCGAVVFTKEKEQIKYLLIQNFDGVYGFPKGHVEHNETEIETALREVHEEVNLKVEFMKGFRTEETYMLAEKKDTMKQVVYFLGEYENQEVKCQIEEVANTVLVDYETAMGLFQFEGTKRVLKEANDFLVEKEMYKKAVELIEKRYPVGWGGAGVVHTANGNYFTSVSIDTANASAILCIETGAMLEAHKYNEKVTHCMCLIRDDEKSEYRVLSPCGICQERLRYWGDDVKVAVTTNSPEIKFVELKELQPYHWTNAYPKEELEHWEG